jgi:polyhydroxyalkanoate synthesis regulator phasin
MYEIDMHFWVSCVGTAADKGSYTVAALVKELVRDTSLSASQARQLIQALRDGGKIGIHNCKVVTLA